MEIGIEILSHGVPIELTLRQARKAEDAGADSLWVGEYHHHGYVIATAVAQSTNHIQIGTGVTLAFPRSPLITALAARDIAEISGGRFSLGLGSQVRTAIEQWHGLSFDRPGTRMADYVSAVRNILEAEGPAIYSGPTYTYDLSRFGSVDTPHPVKIYMAAARPRMIERAAQVAHGVQGHIFWSPRYIADVVAPAAKNSLMTEFEINAMVLCALSDEDPEGAARDARRTLGFYAATRTYAELLSADGFESNAARAREALIARDLSGLEDAVTDEMLSTYAIVGRTEDFDRQLQRRAAGLTTAVMVPAHYRTDPDRLSEQFESLLKVISNRAG